MIFFLFLECSTNKPFRQTWVVLPPRLAGFKNILATMIVKIPSV